MSYLKDPVSLEWPFVEEDIVRASLFELGTLLSPLKSVTTAADVSEKFKQMYLGFNSVMYALEQYDSLEFKPEVVFVCKNDIPAQLSDVLLNACIARGVLCIALLPKSRQELMASSGRDLECLAVLREMVPALADVVQLNDPSYRPAETVPRLKSRK